MMANLFEEYYYVYILESLKDGKNYTGYTKDLPSRFKAHQNGDVDSTKNRRPFKLIYFEGCLNQQDATKREKYLKTFYGKNFYEIASNLISQGEPRRTVWKTSGG